MKSESRIQQEIVQFFRNNYCLKHHIPRSMILHIPNEGKNNGRLVPLGLLPGAADLLIINQGRAIFVEVKDATGKQSPKQKEFEDYCRELGLYYEVVRSLEEFKKMLVSL